MVPIPTLEDKFCGELIHWILANHVSITLNSVRTRFHIFFAIKDHFLIITRLHCSHSRSATCSSSFQEAMMRIAAVSSSNSNTSSRSGDSEPADGETLCSESDSDEEDSDTSLSGISFITYYYSSNNYYVSIFLIYNRIYSQLWRRRSEC